MIQFIKLIHFIENVVLAKLSNVTNIIPLASTNWDCFSNYSSMIAIDEDLL